MSPASVNAFWKNRNRIANFLKHADRDSEAHLNEAEVDNLTLLLLTVSSYHDLAPFGLRAEGYVLVFYGVITGLGTSTEDFSDDELKLLVTAERLDEAERIEFFDVLLETMKEHYGEA